MQLDTENWSPNIKNKSNIRQPWRSILKGPFIIYAWGWDGKNKKGGGGSRQFQDSPRGVMRKLAYKRAVAVILPFCFISKKCVHCCRQY